MIIADCGSGKPHCDSIIRLISPLAGLKPGFGVRQLAAAFLQASLLAGNRDPAERARASSLTRRAAACCRFSSGQPAGRKSRPCRKGASKLAPEESGSLLPLFFRPACWPEIETQPKGREQARSRGKRQLAAAFLQAGLLAGNRDPAERARASSLPRKAAASCRTPKRLLPQGPQNHFTFSAKGVSFSAHETHCVSLQAARKWPRESNHRRCEFT